MPRLVSGTQNLVYRPLSIPALFRLASRHPVAHLVLDASQTRRTGTANRHLQQEGTRPIQPSIHCSVPASINEVLCTVPSPHVVPRVRRPPPPARLIKPRRRGGLDITPWLWPNMHISLMPVVRRNAQRNAKRQNYRVPTEMATRPVDTPPGSESPPHCSPYALLSFCCTGIDSEAKNAGKSLIMAR